MARNADVIRAWIDGEHATAAHLTTDGRDLFSYAYCVASKDPDYHAVVIRSGGHPMAGSMTTSHHRKAAERAAIAAGYPVIRVEL